MTGVSKSYSLPDQEPNEIVLRKGDLGGWTMVARYGAETKTAGFASGSSLSSVLTAMLVGKAAIEQAVKAQQAITEARKPAQVEKAKAPAKARRKKTETAPAPAAAEPAKKRGRPKLSEEEKAARAAARKAANGSEALKQAA